MSCPPLLPFHDITVDSSTEDSLKAGCLEVLARVRPAWQQEHVRLKVFTDGLTNKLLGGWREGGKEDTVLVRVDGEGTGRFIDRHTEVTNMQLLAAGGCGAAIFATFANGLAYQFIAGKVLEPGLQQPEVYQEVARAMARMHRLALPALPPGQKSSPSLWTFLHHLAELYPEGEREGLLTRSQLQREVTLLEDSLSSSPSPLVFCHNDAMPVNMVLTEKGTVAFIDLEYCGPNYAAMDIANCFNEWVGSDEYQLHYPSLYPGKDTIEDWLTHYLTEYHGKMPDQASVLCWAMEVRRFAPVGHLQWAAWSVIQADSSTIQFDYLDYARQRMAQYTILRKEDMELL